MAKPIDQQVVVITGASSGIGRETALRLASKGAKVVASARREEPLDDLVQEIRSAGGEATSIPADVSVFSEVEALAAGAVAAYGRIDTWVNNAGVYLVGEFEKTELDEARRVFDINFWGEYHGCKAVIPIMKQQGAGTIINVSSATANRPLPLTSVYSASKLQGTGIELCMVLPASIDTPLFEHARSKEGLVPRPFPPIYPASEVARAIEKVAVSPRRDVFAGPAALAFTASNNLMPGIMDKVLNKVGRVAALSEYPKRPEGEDNLYSPMHNVPATTSGGWRGRRYKSAELATRIALGFFGFLLLRKLVRR